MASAQDDAAFALPHPPEWHAIEARIEGLHLATAFTRRLTYRINGIPDTKIPPLPRHGDDEEEESGDQMEEDGIDDEDEDGEDGTDDEDEDGPDDESDVDMDDQFRFEAMIDINNLDRLCIFDWTTRRILYVQVATMPFEELVQGLLSQLGVSNTVADPRLLVLSDGVYRRRAFESDAGMLHMKVL